MARPLSGDRGEGRLARWSRLKQETTTEAPVRGGAASPIAIDDSPDGGLPDTRPSEPTPEAEADGAATEAIVAELPPVETLDGGSDYTGFLADGVPEELTRAALRRLWRTDPVFANLDGLNDYDEDFSIITPIARAVGEALSGDDETPRSRKSTPERHAEATDTGEEGDGATPDTEEKAAEDMSAEAASDDHGRRLRADARDTDFDEDDVAEEG